MSALRLIGIMAALVLFLASVVFAQQSDAEEKAALEATYQHLHKLMSDVKESREEVCPTQTAPALCRLEFSTLGMRALNVRAGLANAKVAAAVKNPDGFQKAMSEVNEGLERFEKKFEELVKKYKIE